MRGRSNLPLRRMFSRCIAVLRSMRVTVRAKPLAQKQGAELTTVAPSTPASLATALDALAADGKAVYIVFISAHEDGRRWGGDCAAAEVAIAGVAQSAHQLTVVEASVLQAEWRSSADDHPFRDSGIFGPIQLPLLVEWANGRTVERLHAPAITDPRQVRAFFERTSARATAASATATSDASAAKGLRRSTSTVLGYLRARDRGSMGGA